jgi:two-component system response regulator BaeR
MSARIMIVEDETELASLVADYVAAAGWTAQVFADGAEALAALRGEAPDLLVLDLMLPSLDGLSVCRAVRAFSQLPIIMVTARVEEIDRLLGLETGADDYLCKPFSPRELVARIKALLRRAGYRAPALVVDEDGQRVLAHGADLNLTPTEFALLAAMTRRPGQVFSRASLLDLAAQDNLDVADRAVDSHIKNLRRKLAAAFPGDEPIASVYGLGYRLDV